MFNEAVNDIFFDHPKWSRKDAGELLRALAKVGYQRSYAEFGQSGNCTPQTVGFLQRWLERAADCIDQ